MEASGKFRRPIAAEIVPTLVFWRAKEYHQQYLGNAGSGTCHI